MVKREIEEMACIISLLNHRLEYNYFPFLKFLCPLYKRPSLIDYINLLSKIRDRMMRR